MTAHKHAELMKLYAEDAAETETPWERWEFFTNTKSWLACMMTPAWEPDNQYRRKPRTIMINGFEIPEPLRVAPEVGAEVFLVDLHSAFLGGYCGFDWGEYSAHKLWLSRGLVHSTEEAAIAHTKALLSLTEVGNG